MRNMMLLVHILWQIKFLVILVAIYFFGQIQGFHLKSQKAQQEHSNRNLLINVWAVIVIAFLELLLVTTWAQVF